MTCVCKTKSAVRYFLLAVLCAITVFLVSYGAYASSAPEVYYNGARLETPYPPYIEDGTTLIPMRTVFEALGADILWDGEAFLARAIKDDTELVFYPNEKYLLKNNEEIPLSKSPVIKDDTMFVPLRAVCEGFGCTVSYNNEKNSISITSGAPLSIHFFDCGQADSALVCLPDGRFMLIDGGTRAFGNELCEKLRALGCQKVDIVVATHPHADHIGGLVEVLHSFEVGVFYMPNVVHTTKTFEDMLCALEENGCECEYISRGTQILSGEVSCVAISPEEKKYKRLNNTSAVLRLCYRDFSALLAGDAEATAEADMLEAAVVEKSDVLKVAHHGSATSSSEEFLKTVRPETAVISLGKDNEYGFPSQVVTERLKNLGTKIYRTDLSGEIIIETDGYVYKINK